jgi:very-short-patch-repair endonuclease
LEERGAGVQLVDSGFERRLLSLIARAGLPAPVTQWQVREGEFVCYLDVAWPELLVGVECDSIEHHMSVAAFRWDRVRRRTLKRLGWTLLEFTYAEVTSDPELVLSELRHHLRAANR